jgi:hypothetical protein
MKPEFCLKNIATSVSALHSSVTKIHTRTRKSLLKFFKQQKKILFLKSKCCQASLCQLFIFYHTFWTGKRTKCFDKQFLTNFPA